MSETQTFPSRDDLHVICERAGRAILDVRNGMPLDVRGKADGSPVTAADIAAHRILIAELSRLLPDVPLLSEEHAEVPWTRRRGWRRYWLIDPLDGTREFVDGYPDFTVNVALIVDHRPMLGAVHAPMTGITWVGGRAAGAWRHDAGGWRSVAVDERWPARVLSSRSHLDPCTREWIGRLPGATASRSGSSLKFCMIAEGKGDLYPRFAPTAEWDTAAAQAVLEGAGGAVLDAVTLEPLHYNLHESLLNPSFIACADPRGRWREYHQANGTDIQ